MKPSILLLAASALVAPLSAQDKGPGTDLIDLFEKSQREGTTDHELMRMLEDKALMERKVPEFRESSPDAEKQREILEELLRKDAERARFRLLIDGSESKEPGRAKDEATPRRTMDGQPSDPSLQPPRWLVGLVVKPLVPALRSHFDLPDGAGVLVESIMRDGPAAKAGIRPNDIIVAANGRKVSSLEDLKGVVEKAGSEGKQVHLEVIHRGKRNIVKMEPLDSGEQVEKAGEPSVAKRPMIEIQRRLDQQQREIERLRREVKELRERIHRQ